MSFFGLTCKLSCENTAMFPGRWIKINDQETKPSITYTIFLRAFLLCKPEWEQLAKTKVIKQMHLTFNALELLIFLIDEKVSLCRLNETELNHINIEVKKLKLLLAQHRLVSKDSVISRDLIDQIELIKKNIEKEGVSFFGEVEPLIKILGRRLCSDIELINWYQEKELVTRSLDDGKMVEVPVVYSALHQSAKYLIERFAEGFKEITLDIDSKLDDWDRRIQGEKELQGMFLCYDKQDQRKEVSYDRFIEETLSRLTKPPYERYYSTVEFDPEFIRVSLKKLNTLFTNFYNVVSNYDPSSPQYLLDLERTHYLIEHYLCLFFLNVNEAISSIKYTDEQIRGDKNKIYTIIDVYDNRFYFNWKQMLLYKEILCSLEDINALVDYYITGRAGTLYRIMKALERERGGFNQSKKVLPEDQIEAYLSYKLAMKEVFNPLAKEQKDTLLDEKCSPAAAPTKKKNKGKLPVRQEAKEQIVTPVDHKDSGAAAAAATPARALPAPMPSLGLRLSPQLNNGLWHLDNLRNSVNTSRLPLNFLNSMASISSSAGWAIEQLLQDILKGEANTHNISTLYKLAFPKKEVPQFITEVFLATSWTRFPFDQMRRYQNLSMGRITPPAILSILYRVAKYGKIEKTDNLYAETVAKNTLQLARDLVRDLQVVNPVKIKSQKSDPRIASCVHVLICNLSDLLRTESSPAQDALQQAIYCLNMALPTLESLSSTENSITFTMNGVRAISLMQEALDHTLHAIIYKKGKFIDGGNHDISELAKMAEVDLHPLGDWYAGVAYKSRYPFQGDGKSRAAHLLDQLKLFRQNPAIDEGFKIPGQTQLNSCEIFKEIQHLLLDTCEIFRC